MNTPAAARPLPPLPSTRSSGNAPARRSTPPQPDRTGRPKVPRFDDIFD